MHRIKIVDLRKLTAVELLFDYLTINLRSLYIYIYILDVERGRRWEAGSKQHKQTIRRRGERSNILSELIFQIILNTAYNS